MRHARRVAWIALATACGGAPEPTWLDVLEPLAPGEEVVPGWTLLDPSRGFEHDLVLPLEDATGKTIEVHVVDAGRWASATPAGVYGVDWEEPHTTGPREVADAAREVIADAIRPDAAGSPPVDDVRVGNEPPTALDPVLAALRHVGHRPVVPGLGLVLVLGALAVTLASAGRWAVGAFAVAGLLRGLGGAWAPLHANGQGNLWIRGAGEPALLSHYGPGYAELFGPLARGDRADLAVFALHCALSAAVPVVGAYVMRRRGEPVAGAWVGVWLLLDPVAQRIGATESYLVPASLVALLAAARPSGVRGDAWFALLAAFAARLHPTAWPLIALAPLFGPSGTHLRSLAAGAVGAALGSGVVLADVLEAILDGRLASPASPPHLPIALLALATFGALLRHARAWAGAGLAALVWAALRGSYGQSGLWQAAMDTAWSPWLAIGWAALVARAPGRHGVGAALAAILLVRGAPWLAWSSTDEAEHAWARDVVAGLPADCAVAWVARADEVTTTTLPVYAPRVAIGIDARGTFEPATLPEGCVVYVHAGPCATETGARRCGKVEAALGVSAPDDAVSVPAVPSHDDVAYAVEEVALWWVRVR
jgi:hypothetical protein